MMNIIFSSTKYNKKLGLTAALIFIVFFLLKLTIYTIENYDYQLNLSNNAYYKKEIARLNQDNQKLSQTLEEIYEPYYKFINCPLSIYDFSTKQLEKATSFEEKIYNLQSRHLKGKTPVQIKKIIYQPPYFKTEPHKTNNGKINLVAVHGTMSSWQVFGNGRSASSRAIQDFAADLALIYDIEVNLIVVNWGGELSQKRRLKVGMALGDYMISHHHKNDLIWGIGHSHGCNILNNMTERLKSKNIKADKFILIAPIALDIKPDQNGLNINECYNFYSCGDLVQAAGSSQNGAKECVRFFPQCPETQSYCIQVFPNNEEVDHLTIKIVVLEQLTKLICQIKQNFPFSSYLNAVIFKKDHEPIIVFNDENEGFDNNKYLSRFFKLNELEKLIAKESQINEHNKKKLAEKLGKSLFQTNSQIKSFFKGIKALIQQRSKYPWQETSQAS